MPPDRLAVCDPLAGAQIIDPDEGETPPDPLDSELDLRRELMRVSDRMEELEIKLKVHKENATSPMAEMLGCGAPIGLQEAPDSAPRT